MMKLENFVGMMTGHFDNKDQFNKMQADGKIYPYAEHVNTICNDKINNLPEDFKGKFVVEESYYEINGKGKLFISVSSSYIFVRILLSQTGQSIHCCLLNNLV